MTIGDIYDKLKEITELERTRDAAIGSNRILFNMFLGNNEIDYIQKYNNIPINENSSESDKKIHDEVEKINKRIESLKNVEI